MPESTIAGTDGVVVAIVHRAIWVPALMTRFELDTRSDVLGLFRDGYRHLSHVRDLDGAGDAASTSLLGRTATVVAGPDRTQDFYDPDRFTRVDAIPGFVLDTLFGRGAVHTLDGAAHRARKELMVHALLDFQPGVLALGADELLERAAFRWQNAGRPVSLHDEAAGILFETASDWLGVPVERGDIPRRSKQMVDMIDGFMPFGPRHVRARTSRWRSERWVVGLVDVSRASTADRRPRWDAIVHGDHDGGALAREVAAVEVLNVLRPITAVSWFVAFGTHAMVTWPRYREWLRDPALTLAFVHEVRRYYPFVPLLGARAIVDQEIGGIRAPEGSLVLLDVYGQLHDNRWWDRPEEFCPERFLDVMPDPWTLIPQGGGEVSHGHRCPGEDLTVALLCTLLPRLAAMRFHTDVAGAPIDLSRIPTLPPRGVVLSDVRVS